jgi:hypothetical protein
VEEERIRISEDMPQLPSSVTLKTGTGNSIVMDDHILGTSSPRVLFGMQEEPGFFSNSPGNIGPGTIKEPHLASPSAAWPVAKEEAMMSDDILRRASMPQMLQTGIHTSSVSSKGKPTTAIPPGSEVLRLSKRVPLPTDQAQLQPSATVTDSIYQPWLSLAWSETAQEAAEGERWRDVRTEVETETQLPPPSPELRVMVSLEQKEIRIEPLYR